MALTRKMLKAMGIEEEKIEQIIEAHTETVEALKEQAEEYKDSASKIEQLQSELDEANGKLEQATKDSWKVKYDAIKEEFEDFKADIKSKEVKQAKATAYKKLLTEAGIPDKRIDAILRVTDIDSLDFAKGAFKDEDGIKESIKEEWSDFIVTKKTEGVDTPDPPENTGGSKFEAMSIAEKMAYANEHPNDESVRAWLNKE